MGVNWLPGKNPETMPRLGYIPKISLPTVFGDALSYMEMVNQIVYHFNEAIDGVNNLANDITNVVQSTVEGAKIPVYANLVHNGSVIISPNNWNIDKPEDIWNAIADGKMCILFGNLSFNIDGIPVAQAANKMYFILTECYQTVIDNNHSNVRAVFMNYDYQSVSYINVLFEKNNGVVTSEIDVFTKRVLLTQSDIDAVYLMFKKNVIVYTGLQRIPNHEDEFIELTNNATASDLSQYFVVQTGGSVLAPECAPCIVLDYYNSRVGELRYGGVSNPWARIYGTGVKLNSNLHEAIADINNNINGLNEDIGDIRESVNTLGETVTTVQRQLGDTNEGLTTLGENAVQYVTQAPSNTQKAIARNNIGAASTQDPQFVGELVLNSGYGAAVNFTVTKSGNNTILYFDPVRIQIDGVIDPTSAQQVATKNYVDNSIAGVNSVKYTAQQPTDEEKAIARENIGAVGQNNPRFFETVTVENDNRVLTISVVSQDTGAVMLLGGTSGDKIVRNVGLPVNNNDAANKEYVDNKYVESQNTVKYVQQALSRSQAETARKNIGALAKFQPDVTGPMTVFSGDELDYGPQLVLNSVGLDLNENEYDENLNIKWHPYKYNGSLVVEDTNGMLRPVRGGDAIEDEDFVTKGQIRRFVTPFVVTINASENGWGVLADVPPAKRLLANIIRSYTDGVNVLINYPTTGVTGSAYASPKCVGLDYGIMVEAYNGTVWKRYQLNSDGSVTTTTL